MTWHAKTVTATDPVGDPWLTVVTIVKDDPAGLQRSARSVGAQDCTGVQWLVIDSSSDTGPNREVIRTFDQGSVTYHWTSPEGIYPAMNVGLDLASGIYVHFLNAGDEYASVGVIASVREAVATRRPMWMYGQVAFVSQSGRTVLPAPFDYRAEKAANFSRGRFPPHQGTIARTDALREVGGFDTSFRIVADYAAFLRLSLVADPVEVQTVIARFQEGGISSVRWQESLAEFHRARRSILRPAGVAALREHFETVSQYLRMGAVRMARRTGGTKA